MVKIVTWNVNSIRAHLDQTIRWLQRVEPDVVLLQEIKCVESDFPVLEFQSLGYRAEIVGQKSYNGVALLTRLPIIEVLKGLPGGEDDPQARYVEALIDDGMPSPLRIGGIYLPNGNPVETEKYVYKLAWMDRLYKHAQSLLRQNETVILGGDFNICPSDIDVYSPELMAEDALCRPESRAKFRSILHLGYVDAVRVFHPGPGPYSFWDYQGGAWEKNNGLRIDHFLLSARAADRLNSAEIDRSARGVEKPSDHAPVMITL